MTCARLERGVALWVGGELSARRAAWIAAHVAGCERCRILAERLRADRALVFEAADTPADTAALAAMREHLVVLVRNEALLARRAGRLLPVRLRWATALAAALVVFAAAGVLVMRRAADTSRTLTAAAPRPGSSPNVPQATSLAAAVPPSGLGRGRGKGPASTQDTVIRAGKGSPPARHAVAQSQRPAQREAPAEALVIKLLTDDPAVVIYWLVDQQKG